MVLFSSSMIDYFDSILGFSYASNPTLYLIGVLVIIWFLYQIFGLIYRVFGIKR